MCGFAGTGSRMLSRARFGATCRADLAAGTTRSPGRRSFALEQLSGVGGNLFLVNAHPIIVTGPNKP
jgi:hypothetical protein